MNIGKKLSFLLRHNTEYQNIMLPDGFMPVVRVLQDLGVTFEILNQEVQRDAKGRFAFNEDFSLIRAKQGHSLNITFKLESLPADIILFHGTTSDKLGEILKTGLKPMSRKYVHLTSNYAEAHQQAARFKNKTPAILMVDCGSSDKFHKSDNEFYLTPFIDPIKIRIAPDYKDFCKHLAYEFKDLFSRCQYEALINGEVENLLNCSEIDHLSVYDTIKTICGHYKVDIADVQTHLHYWVENDDACLRFNLKAIYGVILQKGYEQCLNLLGN